MKAKFPFILFILIICVLFLNFKCQVNSEREIETKKSGLLRHSNQTKKYEVKYPTEFSVIADKEPLFYATSNNIRGNTITIFRSLKDTLEDDLSSYTKGVIGYLKDFAAQSDTVSIEAFLGTELEFKEKKAYYSVIYYKQNGADIITLALFVESNEAIYDFKFRFNFKDNLEQLEATFWDVIYSFQFDGKTLLSSKDLKVIQTSSSIP